MPNKQDEETEEIKQPKKKGLTAEQKKDLEAWRVELQKVNLAVAVSETQGNFRSYWHTTRERLEKAIDLYEQMEA